MRLRPPSPALVVACLALLLAIGGTSVAAVTATGNAVNITDPVTAANKAKVDGSGKLRVGDGSGNLTVDGTVSSRPAAPGSPWHATSTIQDGGTTLLAGPSSTPINVASISVSLVIFANTTDLSSVFIAGYHVPGSASSCSNASFDETLWGVSRLTATAPFAVSFPTPLQWKAPTGTKACLYVGVIGTDVTFNASGFIGG